MEQNDKIDKEANYQNWLWSIPKRTIWGFISILITLCFSGFAFVQKIFYSGGIDNLISVMFWGALANLIVVFLAFLIAKSETPPNRAKFDLVVSEMTADGLYPNNDAAFSNKDKFYNYINISFIYFNKSWFRFLVFLFIFYVVTTVNLLLQIKNHIPNYVVKKIENVKGNIPNYQFGFALIDSIKTDSIVTSKSVGQKIPNNVEYKDFMPLTINKIWYAILICLLFNIRSAFVYMCYSILHDLKKVDAINENIDLIFKTQYNQKLTRIISVVVFFAIAHFLICLFDFKHSEQWNILFFVMSGVWGAYTMAMVATHFESRILNININPGWIALILIYSAIHSLVFTLTPNIEQFNIVSIAVLVAALALKVHLFLFVHFLYQTEKLAAYFIIMPPLAKRIGNLPTRVLKKLE